MYKGEQCSPIFERFWTLKGGINMDENEGKDLAQDMKQELKENTLRKCSNRRKTQTGNG